MDIATTLSNSKENIYFKMRMIGLLFSVVKLKFYQYLMRIIKNYGKTTLLSTHPFLQKIINSDASCYF
jgi:hypothetical protein